MIAASAVALVFALEMKAVVSRDIKCLSEAIYFEARGESIKGQIAVANVIKNRVSSRSKTYCDVVHQKGQFSYYWDNIPNKYNDKASFIEARRIAKLLVENKIPDNTNGSVFFKKKGTRSKPFNKLKYTISIGNHDFYAT